MSPARFTLLKVLVPNHSCQTSILKNACGSNTCVKCARDVYFYYVFKSVLDSTPLSDSRCSKDSCCGLVCKGLYNTSCLLEAPVAFSLRCGCIFLGGSGGYFQCVGKRQTYVYFLLQFSVTLAPKLILVTLAALSKRLADTVNSHSPCGFRTICTCLANTRNSHSRCSITKMCVSGAKRAHDIHILVVVL